MFKKLRNTLTALAILAGATACAIVPVPYHGHHDRHDVVTVRPAYGYYEGRHSDRGQGYRHERENHNRRERY